MPSQMAIANTKDSNSDTVTRMCAIQCHNTPMSRATGHSTLVLIDFHGNFRMRKCVGLEQFVTKEKLL